jgi:hypothetical protein
MYEQFAFRVPLDFCNVMGNIIDEFHTQLYRRRAEHGSKGFPHMMGDHLPVGEGHIRRAIHRSKIVLAFLRPERRTG